MVETKLCLLGDDWSSVVVGHDMFWANHDIVSRFDYFSIGDINCVLLHNLFDESLWNGRGRREQTGICACVRRGSQGQQA